MKDSRAFAYQERATGVLHLGPQVAEDLVTPIHGSRRWWRRGLSSNGRFHRDRTHVQKHSGDVEEWGEEEYPMSPQHEGQDEVSESLEEGSGDAEEGGAR